LPDALRKQLLELHQQLGDSNIRQGLQRSDPIITLIGRWLRICELEVAE
jgi:hypothetical protein